MTIEVEYEVKPDWPFDVRQLAEQVIEKAASVEGCPYELEVHLLFTDNENMQDINREYRNIDKPTDVLSFPMVEYESPSDFSRLATSGIGTFHPETGELILGDIILSVEKTEEQAEVFHHSIKREFAFLIAHSMLHLFGYDHMEEQEEKAMQKKQNIILGELHIKRE